MSPVGANTQATVAAIPRRLLMPVSTSLRPGRKASKRENDRKRKNAAGREPSGVEERSEEDLTNLFSRHASADLATTYSPAS